MAMYFLHFGRVFLLMIGVYCATCMPGSYAVVEKQAYMKRISSVDAFRKFLWDGTDVKVVYFYGRDVTGRKNLVNEMEKAAGVMELYGTEFALVDCTKDKAIGYCETTGSEANVYIYRHNRKLLDISMSSMFDLDSIISNVLQIVLLHDAPIIQTVAEREELEMANKGIHDVVISYHHALGTYAHRIFMEIVFAYRSVYQFAITNEQITVQHLLGFSENEESSLWLLRCKEVADMSKICPVVKYHGIVDRDSLAQVFHVLTLPLILYANERDFSNLYEQNAIHTVYICYYSALESPAKNIAAEIVNNFITQLGVVMVNVDLVADVDKMGCSAESALPVVVFKSYAQEMLHTMNVGDIAIQFIAEQIARINSESSVRDQSIDATQVSSAMDRMSSQSMSSDAELEQEIQDDEVAETASHVRKMNHKDMLRNVVELTSKTFDLVTSSGSGPVMVLFYVNFDARSEVLLYSYGEAAAELSANHDSVAGCTLAAINCYDWTDICHAVNVSAYPTLRIYYSRGEPPVLYSGFLSRSAIVNTAMLWSYSCPLDLTQSSHLHQFLSAHQLQDGDNSSRVFGGFLTGSDEALNIFRAAAVSLRGKLLFGLATGTLADTGCAQFGAQPPCTVVVRKRDTVVPFTLVAMPTLLDGNSTEALIGAVERAKLPLLAELKAENFADFHSLGHPFVIAFVDIRRLSADGRHGNLLPALASLATAQSADVIYGWMDVSEPNSIGGAVLRHHVDDPHPEELLYIDLAKGAVHQFVADVAPVSADAVGDWLVAILTGDLLPSKWLSMDDWTVRKDPVDFLALMDSSEMAWSSDKDDYLRKANEDGIGFDDLSAAEDPMLLDVLTADVANAVEVEKKRLERSRLFARPRGKLSHGRQVDDGGNTSNQKRGHEGPINIHTEL